MWNKAAQVFGRELVRAAMRPSGRAFLRGLFGNQQVPPNVVGTPGEEFRPAPGYEWASDAPGDFSVRWVPFKPHPEERLVATRTEGIWHPAPGYDWVSPKDPQCRAVRWVPGLAHLFEAHVVAATQEGRWRAADGYRWVSSTPGDYRVERELRNGAGRAAAPRQTLGQRAADLATLGLTGGAKMRDIESAFRRLVMVHHPDRFSQQGQEAVETATQTFQRIRSAFERLKHPGRFGS